MGPKTIDCIFIGYAHNSAAYRFLVLKNNSNLFDVNTIIIESKNTYFFENVFPMKIDIEKPLSHKETCVNTPESSNIEQKRSKRVRKAPIW